MPAASDPAQRIDTLIRDIARHEKLYYVDAAPVITDREFDALYKELRDLEAAHPDLRRADSPTTRIASGLSEHFEQVPHKQRMLSMDNTYTWDELTRFDKSLARELDDRPREYMVELKIDGASITLWYEQGKLTRALTRGDGSVGEDVTANVKTIRAVPLTLQPADGATPPAFLEVRGEVYMSRKSFAKLNAARADAGEPPFANPRNACAGTLKMLDPQEVARRGLSAFFYGPGLVTGREFKTHVEFLAYLTLCGFPVNPHRTEQPVHTIAEIQAFAEQWREARKKLDYDTDGLVIKINAYADRAKLGATSKNQKWQIAYKYAAEQAKTKLLAVDWQVGKTGVVTPVARLQPVHLAGTTISNASLHNIQQIHDKDIRVGDQVWIEKAGEIIPQVVRVEIAERPAGAEPIAQPSACPSCGSMLKLMESTKSVQERRKARKLLMGAGTKEPAEDQLPPRKYSALICNNMDCPDQVKAYLRFFVSRPAMNIDGFGEKLIDALVDKRLIHQAADLYRLKAADLVTIQTIHHRKNKKTGENQEVVTNISPKHAESLLETLEKSKHAPLWRLITSLNIPLVGKTTAQLFADHFMGLGPIAKASYDELLAIDEVGELIANEVVEFFKLPRNQELIKQFSDLGLNVGITYKEYRHRQQTSMDSSMPLFPGLLDTPNGIGETKMVGPANNLPFKGKVFVITGTLDEIDREQASEEIRKRGGKVTSSVSKNTDILLCGENAGSKLAKAQGLGITIWDSKTFKEHLASTSQ